MSGAAGLVALLRERGLTVATAKSLTGGLVCAALTSVPGASAVVRGGVAAYAVDVKAAVLGVDRSLLAERGVDPSDPAAVRAHPGGSREAAFYQNKVQAAIHFAHRGLPLVAAHAVGLLAGETAPMEAVF